jgi:hypothetical protein
MSKRNDAPQEAIESAAAGAEAKTAPAQAATIEAKAEATTDSAKPADAPPIEPGIGDNVRIFPLAAYKPATQYRFALLAASVAVAAALGGLIGSLSTLGFAGPKTETAGATHQLQSALAQVTKQVAALKASIDASNRAATTQVSKISERLDRSDKAQAEPAQKLAALTETVAKLEKRLAAAASADDNIVTGSIPQRAAAPAAAPKDQSQPAIVRGWVLRDVYRGRALVENRSGLYEVAPGATLPGVGRVETITRQNGRWVVVTPKGLIVSMR